MTDTGALPERIGDRYEVRDCIGSGGAATVFRVYDPVLRVTRALKLLHGQTGAVQQARLEQEARIMVRLDHPHILRVYDLGVDQGRSYVVMDLADGSAQDLLERDGPLRPSEVVSIGVQLLSALSAAHAAGVIHRDIKPQNLLMFGDRVVLADFGIASVADDRGVATRTGMMMGSMAYMPPEQRLDARAAGPRSDLYAVGSTLYALLTGGNPVDLFAAPPTSPRWAGIPQPLLPILQRACAYEASDRYSDAVALAEALKQAAPLVGELPAGAWPEVLPADDLPRQPTSVVVPPLPKSEGRPWLWLLLLLLSLVGAGGLLWKSENPDLPPQTEAAVVAAAEVASVPQPAPTEPSPSEASSPTATPASPVDAGSVEKTTKRSNEPVGCTTPEAFRGSWGMSCATGFGEMILGEKSCVAVVRGERKQLVARTEGSTFRLSVRNSDSESYIFTVPESVRHIEGAQSEVCILRRTVVGTWTGSYGRFEAKLVLKSVGGSGVKGTMTVTSRKGDGSSAGYPVEGSFDANTGRLELKDACTTPDCGQYVAQVTGARMRGTMKPSQGPESTFTLALP